MSEVTESDEDTQSFDGDFSLLSSSNPRTLLVAEDNNMVPNENGAEHEESIVLDKMEEDLRGESHTAYHMEEDAKPQTVHSEPQAVVEEQATPEPVEDEKNKKRHLNVVFVGHVGAGKP
ncbi:hypothetical protein L2E82_22809 [Cichorium intybus]|uniref:Uncharacterized protein n=1 Tax=Cichorium intybus TaxID=13427 RepID=A0ACB9DYD7_CICIN|nr:hypothetical protein L2E82_22809 [Cichorium intybus]